MQLSDLEIKHEMREALPCAEQNRQGDLLIRRIGDSKESGSATPAIGVCIKAGQHGEHMLVATSYVIVRTKDSITVDLSDGGTLYHTDVPSSRHRAIEFTPGCWEFLDQQELGADRIVRKVID
jgi:hypothetical protein